MRTIQTSNAATMIRERPTTFLFYHHNLALVRVALVTCISTLALSSLVACSIERNSFEPLINQGLVPVSEENPFTGANLFLAKEMERSIYLFNFIKEKGSPQAIELKGRGSRDVETHLFYSSPTEEYVAKPAPNRSRVREGGREWIIIGPFSVDRERYKAIQQLGRAHGGVFEIFGRREVLGGTPTSGTSEQLRPVFIPTPIPPKKPTPKKTKHPVDTSKRSGAEAPSPSNETLNFDQQALKEAKDYAPRDANGDIIHTVNKNNQTIQAISQWYTASTKSADEIAARNKLPSDSKLKLGSKVVVPSNLVTNPKRME